MDFDQLGLRDYLGSMGEKPFRATQLINWIHQRGVADFLQMSNISKSLQSTLQLATEVSIPKVAFDKTSADGTRKWLLDLGERSAEADRSGNRVEMVFIPERNRGTLCISSQVGCSLDCSFCSTGRQGFNRNLSTGEIIGQVWLAKALLAQHDRKITNVVLMGMGEPLLNYKNVLPALNLMLDDQAYGLSKRRVTLSTAGVVPAIDKLRQDSDVSLAVSLHAPNDPLRDQLVPLNKKFPLNDLLAACRRYVEGQSKRHITFEYVMLDGVNDRPEHVRQLASILKGIPSKINLIPFNPFPDTRYKRSQDKVIADFSGYLQKKGYLSTIRKTRGDDIDAACGQLVGNVQDRSGRHLRSDVIRIKALPALKSG